MFFVCLHHDRKILENLVKSRNQNQGYSIGSFVRKIKEKN